MTIALENPIDLNICRWDADASPWYNRVVLTGAGFSRNWGGYLASEVWGTILSSPEIEPYENVRQLLLRETGFESALAEVQSPFGRYQQDEREALERAVLAAFEMQDSNLRAGIVDPGLGAASWHGFHESVNRRLAEEASQRKVSTFLFTLNQDLLVERGFIRPIPESPQLPGVDISATRWFPVGLPYEFELTPFDSRKDTLLVANRPLPDLKIAGRFNYVKLHGSFNWRVDDESGEGMMVLGGAKSVTIKKFALLNAYQFLFQKAARQTGARILVIGYSFRDDHINDVLDDAARGGTRIYIVDTRPPDDLRQQLLLGRYAGIWSGVSGYLHRPLRECFKETGRGLNVSAEARQLFREFFKDGG